MRILNMSLTRDVCDSSSQTTLTYAEWEFPGKGHQAMYSNKIADILWKMLKQCCKQNVELNRTRTVRHPLELEEVAETFAFPAQIKSERLRFGFESPFVGLVESSGSVMLTSTLTSNNVVMDLILSLWTVLLLIILTCLLAGVLIWALDSRWNPGNFPSSFLEGFWEGVWWAFVTATTVGYGDRTPRAIPGRLFGIMWTIMGVSMFAVFTACLTTALNQDSVSTYTPYGRKIGVLNGTEEIREAAVYSRNVHVFATANELLKALNHLEPSERVEVALIDAVHCSHLNLLDEPDTRITTEAGSPNTHGVYVHDVDASILKCLHKTSDSFRHEASERPDDDEDDSKGRRPLGGSEKLQQLFPLDDVILGSLAGLLSVIMIVFTLVDCFYWRPKRQVQDSESGEVVTDDVKKRVPTVKGVSTKGDHYGGFQSVKICTLCHQKIVPITENNENVKL